MEVLSRLVGYLGGAVSGVAGGTSSRGSRTRNRQRRRGGGAAENGGEADSLVPDAYLFMERRFVIKNNPWLSWLPLGVFGLTSMAAGLFLLSTSFRLYWNVSLVFLVCGAIAVWRARLKRFIFDATTGKFYEKSIGLNGIHVVEHWLHEIQDVTIDELHDSQGGDAYDLYITLRSGKKVVLLQNHLSGLAEETKFHAREDILKFLKQVSVIAPRMLEVKGREKRPRNRSLSADPQHPHQLHHQLSPSTVSASSSSPSSVAAGMGDIEMEEMGATSPSPVPKRRSLTGTSTTLPAMTTDVNTVSSLDATSTLPRAN
ncbi:hypothetical protein QOT17_011654 [Balamuthia mandrillaris]